MTQLTWSMKNKVICWKKMVKYMKSKFEKYRENFDNMNHLLYISLVIDSRYKLQYLEYCFGYFVREKKKCY